MTQELIALKVEMNIRPNAPRANVNELAECSVEPLGEKLAEEEQK